MRDIVIIVVTKNKLKQCPYEKRMPLYYHICRKIKTSSDIEWTDQGKSKCPLLQWRQKRVYKLQIINTYQKSNNVEMFRGKSIYYNYKHNINLSHKII